MHSYLALEGIITKSRMLPFLAHIFELRFFDSDFIIFALVNYITEITSCAYSNREALKLELRNLYNISTQKATL